MLSDEHAVNRTTGGSSVFHFMWYRTGLGLLPIWLRVNMGNFSHSHEATGWTVWDSIPGKSKRLLSSPEVQTTSRIHPASFSICSGQNWKLTIHLHLTPRLNMSSIPSMYCHSVERGFTLTLNILGRFCGTVIIFLHIWCTAECSRLLSEYVTL
jgi:hypothetical protein